jgi:hypothetical protein
MWFDFAVGRLVPLELRHNPSRLEFSSFRFLCVSDLLVAVVGHCYTAHGGSFCAIFCRANGRRLWMIERPEINCVAFSGPSLLLFTASGVLKVDWTNAAGERFCS